MWRSIASFVKAQRRRRAFLRRNRDVRHVFGPDRTLARARSHVPSPLSADELAGWNDRGVLILRGFFEPSVIDGFKRHVDELWRERDRNDNPVVAFTARGKHPFRDAVDEDRKQTYRLCDQYLTDGPTRDLAMEPRLLDILHQLMGHQPIVCNTLLFEWGSEQDLHSDMFFMPPLSENQMLASWIAVDDVTEDNGPLVYIPRSHKIPPHRFSNGKINAIFAEVPDAVAVMRAQAEEAGLQPERFTARRGDVLVWHSQLMHGGDAIRDRAARRTSLVTHYFSARDIKAGRWVCAERVDGSMLMVKDHLPVA